VPNLAEAAADFVRARMIMSEDFVSYFAAPLIAKAEVKGVLEVFMRTPFSPDLEWIDFVEALAGQAAIAVDNSRLFDGIQRAHLDLTPASIEGCDP